MIILIIPFGLIHVIFQSHESQKKQNDKKSEKYKCEAFQFLLQFAGKIETEFINHLKKKKKNELEKRMGYAENIEKYRLGRTIGEGTFAKVKVANNVVNGKKVAIKIIDKKMVIANDLMYQVQREIRTMKLLNHPNIVRIHEVIGTKTKIYIVMGYAAGGQLSDKLSYVKNLSEKEARKYFQQLIDAVEYCHCRGVYHRDIKPQNLLLDSKGNLKVSDFGLSALQKPGTLLSTACGSPCYVAPELLRNKGYEGAAADVWACGVVLFELLAGRLPFNDHNLLDLYKKILTANYRFPEWFTKSQRRLISKIFDPNPNTRISIIEIIEDEWFQTDYEPAVVTEFDKKATSDDICAAFNSVEDNVADGTKSQTPGFINAFQLIAMSHDLDLSGLFEEKDEDKHRIMLGSKHTINETIERIEAAARDASLSIERMNSSKIKIQPKSRTKCRSCCNLMAEVIEVAPTDCVVEISKSDGKLELYQEFCKSLSSLLTKEPSKHIPMQRSKDDSFISTNIRSNASSEEEESGHKFCGYSSS